MKLTLEHKTGFATDKPFKIYDNKGNEFYSDSFTDHISKREIVKFNVPAGVYNYEGKFVKLPKPVEFLNIVLPPKQRNIRTRKYKIVFGDNPNKCTIFYERGIILFDKQFENSVLYLKYGIYFHELGHHFYKDESKADLYATKKMLDYGFNPSQIGRVGLMSLSNASLERKVKIVNNVKKL